MIDWFNSLTQTELVALACVCAAAAFVFRRQLGCLFAVAVMLAALVVICCLAYGAMIFLGMVVLIGAAVSVILVIISGVRNG